jgi:hypothetical protein
MKGDYWMNRLGVFLTALFMLINFSACADISNAQDDYQDNLSGENPEDSLLEEPVPLTYDELMRLEWKPAIVCYSNALNSLAEMQEHYANTQRSPFAYTTIECMDVRYYIDWGGDMEHRDSHIEYHVKVKQVHEMFNEFSYKSGDTIIITEAEDIFVNPNYNQLEEILLQHGAKIGQNGEIALDNGSYEWIPTKENVGSCLYSGAIIPLNAGEEYIAMLYYSEEKDQIIARYITSISEGSQYLANEGYGIEIEKTFAKIAQELADYVRTEKAK